MIGTQQLSEMATLLLALKFRLFLQPAHAAPLQNLRTLRNTIAPPLGARSQT